MIKAGPKLILDNWFLSCLAVVWGDTGRNLYPVEMQQMILIQNSSFFNLKIWNLITIAVNVIFEKMIKFYQQYKNTALAELEGGHSHPPPFNSTNWKKNN